MPAGADFLDLSDSIEVLVDDTGGRLTVEEAAARDFAADNRRPGYSSEVHWARFQIRNEGDQRELFLELAYPVMDRVDLYATQIDGGMELIRTGDALPFHAREVVHRHFVFKLEVPPQKTRQFYLRVDTTSSTQFPLRLRTAEAFQEYARNDRAILAFYYGGMFVMALYNFLLYLSLRDRSYLYYVAAMVALVFVLLVQNGVGFEYLWPERIWWNDHAQGFSVFLAGVTTVLFCRSFLNLRVHMPRLDRWLRGLAAAAALGAALSLTILPLTVGLRLASLLAMLCASASLFAGVLRAFAGDRTARFYLIAFASLLTAAVMMSLRNFGILSHSFITTYGLQIGSALEATLLSLALADRIHFVRRERALAEQKAARVELAAARQRTDMLADFHDHLGAGLTDITILTDKMQAQSPDASGRKLVDELSQQVRRLVRSFRETLADGDDLYMLSQDLAIGLQVLLVRRYASADRTLDFQSNGTMSFSSGDPLVACLYSVSKELATNDFKYGSGRSDWRLDVGEPGQIALSIRACRNSDRTPGPRGRGIENIRRRVQELGGSFSDNSSSEPAETDSQNTLPVSPEYPEYPEYYKYYKYYKYYEARLVLPVAPAASRL